jgi:hypothetical protein
MLSGNLMSLRIPKPLCHWKFTGLRKSHDFWKPPCGYIRISSYTDLSPWSWDNVPSLFQKTLPSCVCNQDSLDWHIYKNLQKIKLIQYIDSWTTLGDLNILQWRSACLCCRSPRLPDLRLFWDQQLVQTFHESWS